MTWETGSFVMNSVVLFLLLYILFVCFVDAV